MCDLFILIFLLCFGLVMLYSSSSYTSANLYDDSAHYLKLQFRNILVGVIPMYFFARVDYHFWKKFGFFAYFCSSSSFATHGTDKSMGKSHPCSKCSIISRNVSDSGTDKIFTRTVEMAESWTF